MPSSKRAHERAADAHVEPPVAEIVQHRQLAGQLDRVVEGRDDGAGDEPDPPRARGDRAQQHDGVRGGAAVVVEVVLDGLDRAEAERIGALGQAQHLVEVLRGRGVGGAKRGKEVEAEVHALALSRGATSRAKRSRLRLICSGRSPGGTAHVTRSVIPCSAMKAESSATQWSAFPTTQVCGILGPARYHDRSCPDSSKNLL